MFLHSNQVQNLNSIAALGFRRRPLEVVHPFPLFEEKAAMEESLQKRIKIMKKGSEEEEEEEGSGEDDEMTTMVSEEMQHDVERIFHKIELYTQQISELLEASKTLFKTLNSEFEDRMISLHEKQMDKWQEEIKELQLRDASNEAARARLESARNMLLNVHQASGYALPDIGAQNL